MKEFLSHIEQEDYDQIIYPQLILGHMVGIKDMLTDDILFTANPEKYPPIPVAEEPLPPQVKNPLQGEFTLPRPIKIKGRR
jgi:hypothetical protein